MTIHHDLDRDAGAPGVTIRLAEHYAAAGHDVEVLSFDDLPTRVPPRLRPLVFPTFVVARVRRRMRSGALDVVDASSGDSAFLDHTSASFRRTLLAVRSHGLEHTSDRRFRAEAAAGMLRLSWRHSIYHGGYRLREVARSMRRADVALVLNESDRSVVVDELRVAPQRVCMVPNGVPERLVLDENTSAGLANAAVTRIVQLGNYIPRKGIRYGGAALAAVLARKPGIRVAFLGTGCPPSRVLADFDPSLHQRIDVVARYRNEDLRELLGRGDINLLPTLSEGFPGALLEAMARGIPSVVTSAPGTSELCRDGRNALVVRPRDPYAIQEALELLVDSPALRNRLSRAAVATARRYTWPRVASLNLDIYQRHLAGKIDVPAGYRFERHQGGTVGATEHTQRRGGDRPVRPDENL